jgi:hypothetical protein
MKETAKMAFKEKICLEPECQEAWEKLSKLGAENLEGFSYCPFCSNQLMVRCSACNEYINDTIYNFCPWCGERF